MLRPSARPLYAAVVDAMDQAIGRVLQTLDDEGIADDTIVLFMSDNGGAAYAGAGADNEPLRGGKGDTFEGGIRVVALLRWPTVLEAGSRFESIVSVMDVFPTLAGAAGIDTGKTLTLDGRDIWPALRDGVSISLDHNLYFGCEMTVPGSFMLTAFNDEWKLVQHVEQKQRSADVTNYLFRIERDPSERNNLAATHPDVVARLSRDIVDWRSLHPIGGIRAALVPPPGWRASRDWSTYPIPIAELQDEPAPGMPPPEVLRVLDWQHGEMGRLIYDCERKWWLGGACLKRN